ncbi:MAG: 2-oxoacid:acceptor oxidoreductase subunit alpha [Bacteroidia bacterium]
MAVETTVKSSIVIRFAGDSGDGIQLTGTQFTNTTAMAGNDLGTFPDYPAEIRAPAGTIAGVSGFQINFGSDAIHTPGDFCDVLVVMNAAALKANLRNLKKGGIIIANEDGFDAKNLRLAQYEDGENPIKDGSLSEYALYTLPVTKLTREALKELPLSTKEADRSKNMFVLGMLYWLYNRDPEKTVNFLKQKFKNNSIIEEANISVLKAGYHYGETAEIFNGRYDVKPAKMPSGTYRGITGNQATAYGLIAASQISKAKLFYGSYPITPASDILHVLSRHKNFGVMTFQAEDEIAAICSAIGASYGGSLAVTASSGPGIALKTEAIGLAVMLEIPLVVVNVQRSGPSTGMPTKTEQADLMQALYGRNGEAPVPVIAPRSPSDCFNAVYEACRIAIRFMTPVFFLSDGYLGNGAEPWKFPKASELPAIPLQYAKPEDRTNGKYFPYQRDELLVRKWAVPGTKGLEHRIGGLEKEDVTGDISYDPENHEKMVKIRAQKISNIADFIPEQKIEVGPTKGRMLLLGWGSTFGTLKTAVQQLNEEGYSVAHTHLSYLNPLPKNLGEILANYEMIVVPEINDGQLVNIIRNKFLVDAIRFTKIQGLPFHVNEVKNKVLSLLE